MRRYLKFSGLIWLLALLTGSKAFAGISASSDTVNGGKQLQLIWAAMPGAQEYDIEWTTVDSGNIYADTVKMMANGTAGTISPDLLNKIFLHNATRVTTKALSYLLSLVYNNDYIVIRMRSVSYSPDGIRLAGAWDYSKGVGRYAAWALKWYQQNINWQYSAAFAEEGKKKEVVSYFDGTLRGRQTVTINNSDNVAVVQENVYDEFGRATASILPAPYKEATGATPYLHYFKNYNLNASNAPYNSDNVKGAGSGACEFFPDTLPSGTGASLYYSHQNPFLNPLATNYKRYNNFIPDAERYPLSVTQYTADNTGRIKIQGGVGKVFQPGSSLPSKTTKYYYGKPEQWELDQLFGNDAGYASHYLKNMVVDPNGQVSISYINASGKTVATALTGPAPATMDSLVSIVPVSNPTINLLDSSKFVFNASALKITATTTYLSSLPGPAKLKYSIQKLIDNYPGGTKAICSNCYYDLTIKVYNDCRDSIYATTTPVPIGALASDCNDHGIKTDSVSLNFPQIGEYYVTFELAFSKTVMENYTDNFVVKGQANGALKKEFDFILPQLDSLNFKACLSDCTTNEQTLGTQAHFTQAVKAELLALDVDPASLAGAAFNTWVAAEYATLKAYCDSTQAGCSASLYQSPCAQYLQPMEGDVSPGGQYALFDANNNALDTANNVLYKYWRAVFPVTPQSDTTVYNSALITLPDGTVTSVYDSSFTLSQLIQYWQPEWADRFLTYHPEDCKLLFCQNNAAYMIWDQTVQDSILTAAEIIKIPGAPAGFHYDYTNGAWLLAADPFFKAGAPGASLATDFQNDLLNYSHSVLNNNVASVKDLVKFVDYLTYCSDPTSTPNPLTNTDNNWDNCSPAAACRVPDREWNSYKDFYLQLKQQYYNKVRLNTTCANKCTVGTPIGMPSGSPCPAVSDFVLNDYSSADGSPITCGAGTKIMTLSCVPGNVSTTVTVMINYAPGTDTTGLQKTFVFTPGDHNKMFCVPQSLLSQSVSVSSAICASCAVNPLVFNAWKNNIIIQNTYSGATIIARDTLHVDSRMYFDGILTIQPNNTYNVVNPLHTYSGSWAINDSCQFALYSNNVRYTLDAVSTTALSLTHREGNIQETWYFTGVGSAITCANPDTIHVTALQGNNAYFKGAYPTRHLITVLAGSAGTPPPFTCVNSSGGSSTSTSAYHSCLSVYTPYSTVKYQNVWVFDCVYDNVPASCSPTLLTKESRFNDTFTNPVATDSTTAIQQGKDQLTGQVQSSCEANAANWMAALDSGLVGHSADTALLKAKFIAICGQGGDLNHLFGATTVPPGQTSTSGYNSFGDAIKGVLHISTFTTKLNPWLISMPYPYTPLMQSNYRNIASSNADICSLLAQLQTNCNTYNAGHGTTLTLYQYLVLTYGPAMILSAADLTNLQNSCGTCKYLLNADVTLPVFMDPQAKGCIQPSEYSTAKSDLLTQFGGSLDTTDFRYQTIYANFMNQRWGFMLSYTIYKTYEASLISNPSAMLCNQINTVAPPADTLECIKNQLSIGVANGKTAYHAYIEVQKNLFRASYVSTCSAASANVTLRAPQKVYHYTLYYYDQADNLVRTVPPEGVTLIPATSFAQIDTARNRADSTLEVYPQHKIPTYYAYNSTNQVSTQQSPDGGTNRFWYDLLSRLTVSQNDKQLPNHNYSYTRYDSLGRITEVGQKNQNTINIGTPDYLPTATISSFNASGTNGQITNTYYDATVASGGGIQRIAQNNLRKRVALTTYKATQSDTVTQATYYDYDLDGNVKNLYQQVQGLGIKRINYEYDLISGKVNFVAYQNGKADQFYYQYSYDADNRITQAWSSIKADTSTYGFNSKLDPAKQKLDATYQYYLHGPLARMELGDQNTKVQGVDYAYTLQGWIKGVNSQSLNAAIDMGQDSATVAKDAYGYSLGYYTNDYKPIGGTGYTAFNNQYTQSPTDITGQSLYNGNISNATMAISAVNSGNAVGYTYHYDQLNRLKKLRQHSGITTWNNSNINQTYKEDFTYDGNGNILSLLRSGATSTVKDSLLYQYNYSGGRLTNNKLNWLNGNGNATNFGPAQSANNYTYDQIGNLTADNQARISAINWSVYGKITDMLDSTKTIAYKYNTAQQRVTKTANGLTTYYVRDAQGNTLALYDNKASQVNWREQHLYGSSRLGMWQPNVNLATNNASTVWDTIGHKNYELSNHLGNVVTTITDKRISHTGYYSADITTAQDYYAFGALMPNRTFTLSNNYRYGFNGKENDNEVKGTGNQQDYGMRIYDGRVGRFLSTDPLAKSYPELTPYQFASNRPIDGIDEDGLEWSQSNDTKGNTNVAVNIKLDVTDVNLSKNQITQYENAINNKLNEVLQNSTNKKYSGKVTFNAGDDNERLVPSLSLTGKNNSIISGLTGNGFSTVKIYKKDGSLRPIEDVATDAVHELFHTVRFEHPFEKTQGLDTKLINVGPNQFKMTNTTSLAIFYDIMNYSMITINGQKLGSLWSNKKPSLITSDQVKLLSKEIGLQMQGYGVFKYDKKLSQEQNAKRNTVMYQNYWNNTPGTDVPKAH